jgi:ABC-type antimicrobial peptide transport system permease subunit
MKNDSSIHENMIKIRSVLKDSLFDKNDIHNNYDNDILNTSIDVNIIIDTFINVEEYTNVDITTKDENEKRDEKSSNDDDNMYSIINEKHVICHNRRNNDKLVKKIKEKDNDNDIMKNVNKEDKN